MGGSQRWAVRNEPLWRRAQATSYVTEQKLTVNIGVGKGGPLVTRKVLATTTLGMMAYSFHPSTQEAGAAAL